MYEAHPKPVTRHAPIFFISFAAPEEPWPASQRHCVTIGRVGKPVHLGVRKSTVRIHLNLAQIRGSMGV
jgi:hypothetical protein